MMAYINKYKKELIALLFYVLYFILSSIILSIILSLGIDVNNSNKQVIYTFINLCLPILLIIIYRKELFKGLKDLKSNYRKYLDVAITYYVIGLVGMVSLNVILQFFLNLGIANNEESVRQMIELQPIYTFISACIIAPFQEEMVFRKTFKDIFKNKLFYIIFSGFIFGALHVVSSITAYTDILFLLPYGFLGSIFALIYVKTDNILIPILLHTIHNTCLVLLQMNIF